MQWLEQNTFLLNLVVIHGQQINTYTMYIYQLRNKSTSNHFNIVS